MKKQAVVERLLSLPREIEGAETELLWLHNKVEEIKEEISRLEAVAFGEGKIDGTNEQKRKAQLREVTGEERKRLHEHEQMNVLARIKLNRLHNEFKALRSVSLLVSDEDVAFTRMEWEEGTRS
ncbi:hypothetical protein [Paenibacillus turpanensis]|uniref:hypothetical protein n=1 Tax=Paenibacillus turpanensis TaxID=2689078 RepID=UPI00140D7F87|nr:hypothetical protein [Paenibacillus turpanensis]